MILKGRRSNRTVSDNTQYTIHLLARARTQETLGFQWCQSIPLSDLPVAFCPWIFRLYLIQSLRTTSFPDDLGHLSMRTRATMMWADFTCMVGGVNNLTIPGSARAEPYSTRCSSWTAARNALLDTPLIDSKPSVSIMDLSASCYFFYTKDGTTNDGKPPQGVDIRRIQS